MFNINTDRLIDIYKALNNDFNAFASQQLIVTTTAQNITLPTIAKAKYALVSVESDVTPRSIRIFETGELPTASKGLIFTEGDKFDITGSSNLTNFKVILDTLAAASTVTKINIQYYK